MFHIIDPNILQLIEFLLYEGLVKRENKQKKNTHVAQQVQRDISSDILPSLSYGRRYVPSNPPIEDQIKDRVDAKASDRAKIKRFILRKQGPHSPAHIKRVANYGLQNSYVPRGDSLNEGAIKSANKAKKNLMVGRVGIGQLYSDGEPSLRFNPARWASGAAHHPDSRREGRDSMRLQPTGGHTLHGKINKRVYRKDPKHFWRSFSGMGTGKEGHMRESYALTEGNRENKAKKRLFLLKVGRQRAPLNQRSQFAAQPDAAHVRQGRAFLKRARK